MDEELENLDKTNVSTTMPQENVRETRKRGRPKTIELPETSIDEIESIEEVVNEGETIDKVITNTEILKEGENTKESKPETTKLITQNKYHTANYLYKKDEEIYLVNFESKSEEGIFGSIDKKYKFRPLKTKIKEVIINEDNSISYRVSSCQGCFKEKLITKTEEECQKICDLKNMR